MFFILAAIDWKIAGYVLSILISGVAAWFTYLNNKRNSDVKLKADESKQASEMVMHTFQGQETLNKSLNREIGRLAESANDCQRKCADLLLRAERAEEELSTANIQIRNLLDRETHLKEEIDALNAKILLLEQGSQFHE